MTTSSAESTAPTPNVLAIDCSTPVLGFAIAALNPHGAVSITARHEQEHDGRHIEQLPLAIEAFLAEYRIPHSAVSAIGVARGPGSFTGLRVGMSAAKAISAAWHIPLLAVDCLEALARCEIIAGGRPDFIIPVIDARKSRYYAAVFRAEAGHQAHAAGVVTLDRLTENLDTDLDSLQTEAPAAFASRASWAIPGHIGGKVDLWGISVGRIPARFAGQTCAEGIAWLACAALGSDDQMAISAMRLGPYDGPAYLRQSDIGRRKHQPRFISDPPQTL